jgi:hypothetical protein
MWLSSVKDSIGLIYILRYTIEISNGTSVIAKTTRLLYSIVTSVNATAYTCMHIAHTLTLLVIYTNCTATVHIFVHKIILCVYAQVLDKPTSAEEQKELIAEVKVTDMFSHMHFITGNHF